MYIQTVTQKGQVALPKKLRDALKIKTRGKVWVERAKDYIKVYPDDGPHILDLAGKFKVPKGTDVLKAREEMEKNYSRF
jgi:AbrB family looped-hinge helix DNA binding protein